MTVFKVGAIKNAAVLTHMAKRSDNSLTIKYPARLEAMALDPAKIATNDTLVYTAGQIDVSVSIFKTITVTAKPFNGSKIEVKESPGRKALIAHAGLLMYEALDLKETLEISCRDELALRHCGLGSSSGTISGVMSAINELYGRPIGRHELCLYAAQNHGEELDGSEDELVAVQCIGGSAVCGNYTGSVIVLSGQATPIARMRLPANYTVVIGVPRDFNHPDSKELMRREEENMTAFVATGKAYGKDIAYRLVHEVLPEMQLGQTQSLKQLVFDYRWEMGSIRNCSFVLPRINTIATSLRPLVKDEDIKLLALSSVGPGFFAVTTSPEKITEIFESLNMQSYVTKPFNEVYQVMKG